MNSYPEYVQIEEKKYKINTDFRIALECNSIANDTSIGDYERALAIIYKLYGDEGLNSQEHHVKLLELAQKYLSCGVEIEQDGEPDMDYEQDIDYVKASFRSDYNINLDKEEMHWWEFNNLINGLSNSELGNCCVLNRIRNLRNMDLKEIKDPKEKEKIRKAKELVALKKKQKVFTDEQKENIRKFYELSGIDRKE